ncbi:helicase-related protein [Ekhidna sp.]|uniref:helicase-related protein n=1 Tax=Ekhidna sp. TaxID=2608089 RepID=UPI003CCBDA5F
MRDSILDYLKKELIGPDPVEPYIQANGEEILINEPPRLRYSAGILFPQTITYSNSDSNSEDEEETIKNEVSEIDEDPVKAEDTNSQSDVAEDFEEEIGLANNFMPAAMGLSCLCVIPDDGFKVLISAAIYEKDKIQEDLADGRTITKQAYLRIPIDQSLSIARDKIPVKPNSYEVFSLQDKDGNDVNLKLHIRNRSTNSTSASDNFSLLTFTLINTNQGSSDSVKNEDCFFQVSFKIQASENCFHPYKPVSLKTDKEDEKSNQLLYRNKRTFAVGHGCSPVWANEDDSVISSISAKVIPSYEVKPIVPNSLPQVELKMYDFSDFSQKDFLANLRSLCDHYELWIKDQEEISKNELSDEHRLTATRHIASCYRCLERMREGVDLIAKDLLVKKSFQLMNRAMLLQQLHYSIETREWIVEDNKAENLKSAQIPNIHDKETWKSGLGSWRPFQIAFVLMNLNSMLDPKSRDRRMVDLIWFPTGGGKTEAYLGLSAFSIFLKRLRDPTDSGTTVLMRYTLRLLTAQQFQRASSLICACDLIRKEFEEELGSDRITIGLWVGESLTPLTRQKARTQLQKLENNQERNNPFILLKCPWCGAQMGVIDAGRNKIIKGYRRRGNPQTIVYKCDNPECDFHNDSYPIPCIVIDEDIYDYPPTLLIGTVDKFAMLTWKPSARSLFGFRDGSARVTPPELIIQDELHLISGPLGSMVGLYETMIEELCTKDGQIPKIIASSATISRAKEQINSIYGRGEDNVTIFPPQCINAGDSFFAFEDKESPGRKYVGVYASGLPSHASAQVRVFSSLLQATKSISVSEERERDPYWTVLTYFNSIRELGHAATLIRADIREYMNSIWIRKRITGDERRFINRDIELTSRIGSNDIPEYLEQLSKSWTGEKSIYPVDVCLATNMISVGVDISRLGLMSVVGQPKTTSEYIQATSRVGRSKKGPGLVFTVYNCSKPRDRSHYEHFQEYHSKIYSKVEPTSVTPFSAPARERALHAILVGLIRYYSAVNRESPRPFPDNSILDRVTNLIYKRVNLIDPSEQSKTIDLIEEKLDYWKNEQPVIYGSFGQPDNIPLMYPSGSNPAEDIKLRAWATPTSMRNVDATCDAIVVTDYPNKQVI